MQDEGRCHHRRQRSPGFVDTPGPYSCHQFPEVDPHPCSRWPPHRSEEHTSELQSPMSTLFPYTTLFRSTTAASALQGSLIPQDHILVTNSQKLIHTLAHGGRHIDRKSTRLNSSHRCLPSFPTRRSSDLPPPPALSRVR